MEVAGAMQDKGDSVVSEAEQVELDGVGWTRVAVQWTDAQGQRSTRPTSLPGCPATTRRRTSST